MTICFLVESLSLGLDAFCGKYGEFSHFLLDFDIYLLTLKIQKEVLKQANMVETPLPDSLITLITKIYFELIAHELMFQEYQLQNFLKTIFNVLYCMLPVVSQGNRGKLHSA